MPVAVHKSSTRTVAGNATVAVVRMNGADSVHRIALKQQFCEIIGHEAKTFGAPFDDGNFDHVIDAVSNGKAQAYFLLARGGANRPLFIGASIQFMSVISKWNGHDFEHFGAPYIEDMCISSQRLSEFMRSTGTTFEKGANLGSKFMQGVVNASIENSFADTPLGVSGRGFIAEYAPDGKQIIRVLKKFGATLGQEDTSAIMELDYSPAHQNIDVDIQCLSSDDKDHANIFVVEWADATKQQRIVASFTEALSSFTGKPIIRAQFSTNGHLPSKRMLPEILKSILAEGGAEAVSRDWFDGDAANAKMYIHVLEEPQIISALKTIGANSRMLGNRPMLPLMTDFRKSPADILSAMPLADIPLLARKPLRVNAGSFGLMGMGIFTTCNAPSAA